MKQLILIVALILNISAYAQDDKTVTLTVSGQGKTQEEAKQVALRSAIEQAFGAFISSKTEILNDKLVKDEIVSVTNGNIQKYDVLSEVQIPEGGYATTLKAVVSVSKLTSFCESKGVVVEFKGGLFAMNIKMQQLNEQNEIQTLKTLCQTLKKIADKSFNYSIKTTEPTALDNDPNKWLVNISIEMSANENLKMFKDYLLKVLVGISMKDEDKNNYLSLNKKYYRILIDSNLISLRSFPSVGIMQDICWYLYFSQANFIINDGINNYSPYDIARSYPYNDNSFVYNYSLMMDVVDFKIPRYFQSNWSIIERCILKHSESDMLENTPFGDFSKQNRSCTYALTKKAISVKYNYYKSHVGKKYYEYSETRLRSFADSSTVYVSQRGFDDDSHPVYEDGSYLKIHPYPNSEQFAVLTLELTYNTDELGKITLFSVKPGKLEEIKK